MPTYRIVNSCPVSCNPTGIIKSKKIYMKRISGSAGMDYLGSMPFFALKLTPAHFNSRDLFVNFVANNYHGIQDNAHNAILEYLLKTDYSPDNKKKKPKTNELQAYLAMFRGGALQFGSPLYWSRDATQAKNTKNATFFIRDYMQLNSAGGVSGDPLIVEKKTIQDSIMNSGFAIDFNSLVTDINKKRPPQYANRSVFPFAGVAHRDGIQLIPSTQTTRYAADLMQHVTIQKNNIHSAGELQGIFASDGAFRELKIKNNIIHTGSKYKIRIAGLLSGEISGNKNNSGQLLKQGDIELRPIRIGGGANIYIISFDNGGREPYDHNYYEYKDLDEGSQQVTDLRKAGVANAHNWIHVDMVIFRKKYKQWIGNRNVTDTELKKMVPKLLKQAKGKAVS